MTQPVRALRSAEHDPSRRRMLKLPLAPQSEGDFSIPFAHPQGPAYLRWTAPLKSRFAILRHECN